MTPPPFHVNRDMVRRGGKRYEELAGDQVAFFQPIEKADVLQMPGEGSLLGRAMRDHRAVMTRARDSVALVQGLYSDIAFNLRDTADMFDKAERENVEETNRVWSELGQPKVLSPKDPRDPKWPASMPYSSSMPSQVGKVRDNLAGADGLKRYDEAREKFKEKYDEARSMKLVNRLLQKFIGTSPDYWYQELEGDLTIVRAVVDAFGKLADGYAELAANHDRDLVVVAQNWQGESADVVWDYMAVMRDWLHNWVVAGFWNTEIEYASYADSAENLAEHVVDSLESFTSELNTLIDAARGIDEKKSDWEITLMLGDELIGALIEKNKVLSVISKIVEWGNLVRNLLQLTLSGVEGKSLPQQLPTRIR